MAKFNLNNQELAEKLAVISKYAVENSKTSVDEELLASFSAKFNESTEPVTDKEVVAAVLGLLEVVTDATETKWDDTALTAAKLALSSFGVLGKVENWLKKITG